MEEVKGEVINENANEWMKQVGVAQAIYDNQAEWPDELAFERGEILRVLNERPSVVVIIIIISASSC
ncbi:unnamed protein product [Brugia pahangi]|uniref:SH3 domain-containing protein n=1 Tax=Brugia pahangi TaxID=6280 RepID=A0A0N4T9N9_BRUPA|nr:unnamed protein product [Brugia pahangi]